MELHHQTKHKDKLIPLFIYDYLAAEMVRDESVGPREAVRQRPELAGTYLNLRAAELASRALRDREDQKRFVSQVRGSLAEGIERGEPLQPVRPRTRALTCV
jgi:hypothetical protein